MLLCKRFFFHKCRPAAHTTTSKSVNDFKHLRSPWAISLSLGPVVEINAHLMLHFSQCESDLSSHLSSLNRDISKCVGVKKKVNIKEWKEINFAFLSLNSHSVECYIFSVIGFR